MDILRFAPDDDAALAAWTAVRNASDRHDAPWHLERTVRSHRGAFTHGWDGEPGTPFLGSVDGEPVVAAAHHTSEYDNLDLAWLSVDVRPDRRRAGLGSAMLDHLESAVAGLGRTTVGISCWDVPGLEAFGHAHGYATKAAGINRRQHLTEVDPAAVDALYAEATAAATAYELVRWPARSPEADLDALAAMTAAINDAPRDALEMEDEVFDAGRIRAYERAQAARELTLYRLVARHRTTGELAGQTAVVVDREQPHLADQHDTSVLQAHRGHRLGAALKAGMLRWLREAEPQVETVDTWNAESNAFMIGVNDHLGYRVMGRALDLQKRLRPTSGVSRGR